MAKQSMLSQVAAFLGDIGRARNAAIEYNRLDMLSDAALKARGLSRGDLPRRALDSAFGDR